MNIIKIILITPLIIFVTLTGVPDQDSQGRYHTIYKSLKSITKQENENDNSDRN